MGGTGWGVEMAKVLNKVLYVYDVEQNIWFWYNPKEDFFYACEQMSEEQYALPTLVQKTAILSYHIKTARMSRNFVTHLSYNLFYKKDSVRYGHRKEIFVFYFMHTAQFFDDFLSYFLICICACSFSTFSFRSAELYYTNIINIVKWITLMCD